jgi:hypothetical protein
MATVMKLFWAGLSPKDYDAVLQEVGWEREHPAGSKYHVAWFTDEGLHALDVWASGREFEAFVQGRLMPGVKKLGIPGEPKVELFEAYRTFAPNP